MALAAQEREQITVHLVLMRSREAMGGARVVDVFGAVDEARRFSCGVVYRHDLIVLAVQDESGNLDLLQIFGEVSF